MNYFECWQKQSIHTQTHRHTHIYIYALLHITLKVNACFSISMTNCNKFWLSWVTFGWLWMIVGGCILFRISFFQLRSFFYYPVVPIVDLSVFLVFFFGILSVFFGIFFIGFWKGDLIFREFSCYSLFRLTNDRLVLRYFQY